MTRVCRVVPDVTAIDRPFDYAVPDALARRVAPGAVVRVMLHGRRVRGWVVADDVAVDGRAAESLLDVLSVVSEGPPPDVVDLAAWIAWRWCGPRVAVLRSASAPNVVPPDERAAVPLPPPAEAAGTRPSVRVLRRPPLADRRALVASMCSDTGSTIVVVADADRARTLASYLRAEQHAVAFLHSATSDAERTSAWRVARRGDVVVVGGRIAALAPVPDLRAAVLVDDADESLQEERAPTWHAREVLRERARRACASFTIVSPAPTVEAATIAGEVDVPPPDVERAGWPRVQVVDRRDEPPGAGLLSAALADALRASSGLSVCVLNRRGRVRVLACPSCRHVLRWDRVDERPLVCPECGATRLRTVRAGVTRVGEELAALLPGRRVVDVDAATTAVPDADIVIGTEAALHRAEIRRRLPALVAYLDLDQELLAPRYRAATQAHWLVTRGAQLLASRPRTQTRILLQTRMPDDVVVRALVDARPDLVVAS